MTGTAFDYTTLKQAITKPSPLRDYLNATFPNAAVFRGAYKASVGPLLAPGTGTSAGTVGTAFDNMVRLTLDPGTVPVPVSKGAARIFGDLSEVLETMAKYAPSSPEDLASAGWVFALFTEAYRNPFPPEALLDLAIAHAPAESLLELANDGVLADLMQLQEIAEERFYPLMSGSVAVGPVFDQLRIAADGDLIHEGALIEIKTSLGVKDSRGERHAVLEPATLNQLLAYALLDIRDEHRITALGLYSARYGHYARWDMAELLGDLAGRRVDLAAERERVAALIGLA